MRNINDVVFVAAVRSPMGRFGGTMKNLKSYEIAQFPIREALKRAAVSGGELGEAIIGTCRQAGNYVNPAHTAAYLGGIPYTVPAVSINEACPSGMKAIQMAMQTIQVGAADIVLAGGMESMSTMPYLIRGYRFRSFRFGDIKLEDGWTDSADPVVNLSMGQTAELLVDKYSITRKEMDEFALSSHKKAAEAQDNGWFDEEIAPVIIPATKKIEEKIFDKDESIRRDTDMQKLAKLSGAFRQNGNVTAGNSSGLTDGAAALVAMDRKTAKSKGVTPLFSLVGYAHTAVDGKYMGEGPAVSIKKALKAAGMKLSDMDLIEVNEAFSAQIIANERVLSWDRDRLNINGGAIALGHPTGCSGARIVVTLYYALKRLDKEYGIAAICGGGGTTAAVIIKRES